jgi:hypothetical protein
MKTLGLIGGLGPGATIHYYRELADANAGEMLLIHADMKYALSHVTSGDHAGLAVYFARLIERLAGGGAEIAGQQDCAVRRQLESDLLRLLCQCRGQCAPGGNAGQGRADPNRRAAAATEGMAAGRVLVRALAKMAARVS